MPTVVITGAGSGIGHAWAEILIAEGYEVHALDVEPTAALTSLSCKTHIMDIRDPSSIASFAQT